MNNNTTSDLALELNWLKRMIEARVASHSFALSPASLPEFENAGFYAEFIHERGFQLHERLVIILALAPYLATDALEGLRIENNPGRVFQNMKTGTLLPTVETALWLMAGDDLSRRLEMQKLFQLLY